MLRFRSSRRRAAATACGLVACATVLGVACVPDYSPANTADAGVDATSRDAGTDGGIDAGAFVETGVDSADASLDAEAGTPSGMVRVEVTGAAFDMYPPASGNPLDPWYQARLTRSFYVDIDEVTVDRLKAWVAASAPVPSTSAALALDDTGHYPNIVWHGEDSSWTTLARDPSVLTGNYTVADGGVLPINVTSWFTAVAFCWFDGHKRLLTEAEWAYVATGHGDRRAYPWGDASPDCTHAIYTMGPDAACPFPVPVETAAAGRSLDGLFDVAGSLEEWLWDVQANEPDSGTTDYSGPPVALDGSAQMYVVGGSFTDTYDRLSPYNRRLWPAGYPLPYTGIRCAKTAP